MKKKLLLHIIITVIVICAGALACQNARPPIPPKAPEELLDIMVNMNPQKPIRFGGIPEALERMNYISDGDTIFTTPKKDTVILVTKFPNPVDKKNRYNTFFIKYTNGEKWLYWWIFREGKEEIYYLYLEHQLSGIIKEVTFNGK